ncbi:MAG: DUF4157 domain-containing protein [Myxococcales bacterium]
MTDASSSFPGPWLVRDGRRGYRLSHSARDELAPVLSHLRLDADRPRIVFGFTAQASAFVLGDRVTVHRRRWRAMTPARQLGLLAHELVHVAQYAALGRTGVARFLVRYLPEYHLRRDNYALPAELAATALRDVELLDRRYTLDQIAERFRHEVAPSART